MELEESLDIIDEEIDSEVRHHLQEGLPDGAYEDRGFDETLIKDIARAVTKWKVRVGK
jgi:hypothetical protein